MRLNNKNRKGFSLVEVLIVISVVAILGGMLSRFAKPAYVVLFTNDLSSIIQQSRYEAVERNTAVAIIYMSNQDSFQVRALSGNSQTCNSTDYSIVRTLNLIEYGTVNVSINKQGLIWLPNGMVLGCDGASTSITVDISDNSQKARTLTINSVGHVEVN